MKKEQALLMTGSNFFTRRENNMPHKGTLEWYKEAEQQNTALRSHLLKHVKRKSNETPHQWLYRVNSYYLRDKYKEVP